MSSRIAVQHLFRTWRHHFALQITTVFVLSLVLITLSLVLGTRENLSRLNALWGDNLALTLYFKDDVDDATMAKFTKDLESEGEFAEVKLVSKVEAMRRFTSRMGPLSPDFLKSSDLENPLPSSVEIKLKEMAAEKKVPLLKTAAARFSNHPLIEEASFGQGWIENWAGFLTSVQWMSGVAVFLTMLLGLLVIGNSVRVSLSQRREEIEVLELVGATSRWIRLPFIVEGAVSGLLASLVAIAIGYFFQSLVLEYVRQNLAFWSVIAELKPMDPLGWTLVSVVGTSFGAFGAFVCVRRLNNGWSAAERWDA